MTHTVRKSEAINVYGDKPLQVSSRHGTDISSSRLDDLDKAAIRLVLDAEREPLGIDLGCGLGIPGIVMAALGARMHLFDAMDLADHFQAAAGALHVNRIVFAQKDLRTLRGGDLPTPASFVYSQRFLHYLRYREAGVLLSACREALEQGGRLFLSASGLHSELGTGYAHRATAIEERFASLSPDMQDKHAIFDDVCLYTEEELAALAEACRFRTVKVWRSGFGNIKGIFQV